jgi:hypothetical protein
MGGDNAPFEAVGKETESGKSLRRDAPIPRVFWEKRLQAIENKGSELQKERQESSRGRKRVGTKELA